MFTFSSRFTADQRRGWMEMLRALPAQIPELRRLEVGENVVPGPHAHEIALVADFDDLAGLAAYTAHPAHQAVTDISGPVRRSLATVDFPVSEES